nr:class I SAM-dependent methyltransferase [uncultured Friedmanniella sp.]
MAAAGLALFGIEAATAALAVSWLCGLGWMVVRSRAESAKLNQILKHQRASRRELGELQTTSKRLVRRSSVVSPSEQQAAQQLKLIRKELYGVLVWVQRTPSVTQELRRVYDRVVDHDRPMPELGDWAMSASTLIWLLDRLQNPSVRTILECGSGSSTIWFATALAKRGGEGRVVALETSAAYAESTRAELAKHGLEDRAQVLHAPLVDTTVPGRDNQPWFDLSVLPDLPPVDLLFVDGPVGGVARQVRYPAFPLLAHRLAPDATVVLDDTGRPAEAAIVQAWKQETHSGRRLRQVRRLDRATAFVSEEG